MVKTERDRMSTPVALITGAGRGIGRATAIELSRHGYQLALISRTPSELDETARLAGGGEVIAQDVSAPGAAARLVASVVERFGRIDAVVHCAGVAPARSIAEMSDEEWRLVIDTNLSAAFYLCRAVWRLFERQEGGVIVNVSSAAARDPFPGFAAYGAAKAAINVFGLSAAREGAPAGIRVHTIAPGAVETKMLRGLFSTEAVPKEMALQPEDVARVIVQCVRGDLRYTSGEVIYLQKSVRA
jgi:NAD(P)-dependent dehydrogenase (short-subunit alcohol dehydrogenase family)